jgi:hypothetical protein
VKRCLALVCMLGLAICGCGGGSSSTPPPPQSAVTSIAITPTSANVSTGQTKQFSATVSGNGNFSQAVTWSVAGDGSVDTNGLFTAGSSSGTATVQVAPVEDPMVINSASVTVSAVQADLGDWNGSMTNASGTQATPLDFHLSVTGNALSATGYGPLTIYDNRTRTIQPNCTNMTLQATPIFDNVSGDMVSPNSNPNSHIALSGTQNGTGLNPGDISLTWQAQVVPYQLETTSLSGQFSPDGSTLSGNYSNTGFLAGCFPSGTSGTFTFTKYASINVLAGPYTGTFTYGTAGQIPLTMINQSITIGAIPGVCGSATTVDLLGRTNGRFFFFDSNNVTKSSLAVWGIMNDTAGQTITIYTAMEAGQLGGTQDSPCVSNPVGNGLIDGITLTKQ